MDYEPVAGPGVWYGRELARRDDWIQPFAPRELDEIDAAVRMFTRTGNGVETLSPASFPLPSLGSFLRKALHELLEGRGFILLRGLPVERMTREEQAIAYLGLGSWLGRFRSQNAKGHLLGHVKDLGLDIRDPNVRYYQTNRKLEYHTDSIDVVGLLCLKPAKAGGESYLASSMTVYNEILKRKPGLLPALFEPFPTDRRGEVPEGMKPWFDIPVFHRHAGKLSCIYVRQYIESAQKHFPEARRLSPEQRAAMDLVDEICNDSGDPSLDGLPPGRHPAPAQPPDPAFARRLRELARARAPSPPAAPLARAARGAAAARGIRAALWRRAFPASAAASW